VTFGAPDREAGAGVDWRGVVLLLVGAAGLAACLTWVFLGMRAVMDIGGACADGGPFVPVQPCPAGVPLLMTFGIFGLFAFGGVTAWGGARVGGAWAALPLLAWPALFLSLGWNFLEYGFAPPAELAPDGGWEWGWIIPGVIFVLMGAVPLWLAWTSRSVVRTEGGGALARRFGMPGTVALPAASPRRGSPGGATPDGDDLVDRLERLAALHRDGSLSDAEYEAAKRAVLGEGGS
jgi:hypothetical protein